jgi:hypothetical protein
MSDERIKIVGYFRMSGRLQGLLRAELEEQRAALREFTPSLRAAVIAECVDYENGNRSPFVQLDRAIELCRSRGATLVMPRMGPLVKDWNVLVKLHMADVHVLALDFPGLSREKLKELAVIARRGDRRLPGEERLGLPGATPALRGAGQ